MPSTKHPKDEDALVEEVEGALRGAWRVGVRVRVRDTSLKPGRGITGTILEMHPPGDPNPVFHRVKFGDGAVWISDQDLELVK